MQLTEITIYPIKSCAGLSCDSVALDRFGPVGDRRWLVVDDAGTAITQREYARMSQIGVNPGDGGLTLRCGQASHTVPTPGGTAAEREVQVWADTVQALDAGEEAAAWLSEQLGTSCRLTFMPEHSVRPVDTSYASAGETVGFADAFPLLLISQASLDDLNARLPEPVPMNRFRPNLVVDGCEAFAEDSWRQIRIGELTFDVANACARCVMPSIVQESAERDPHINRVLAKYRRRDGQIYFGQNLLYQAFGTLAVGDEVEILS
jgi:MOSC domain-containing protein